MLRSYVEDKASQVYTHEKELMMQGEFTYIKRVEVGGQGVTYEVLEEMVTTENTVEDMIERYCERCK